jgi:hypothetical protein
MKRPRSAWFIRFAIGWQFREPENRSTRTQIHANFDLPVFDELLFRGHFRIWIPGGDCGEGERNGDAADHGSIYAEQAGIFSPEFAGEGLKPNPEE